MFIIMIIYNDDVPIFKNPMPYVSKTLDMNNAEFIKLYECQCKLVQELGKCFNTIKSI